MLQATRIELGVADTSCRCEGGEGVEGEVVKENEVDHSL
jgi:hypothetical protein